MSQHGSGPVSAYLQMRMRKYCGSSDLGQREIAKLVGVSVGTVNNVLQAKRLKGPIALKVGLFFDLEEPELYAAAWKWWQEEGRANAPPEPTASGDRFPSRARAIAWARGEGYPQRAIDDVQAISFTGPGGEPAADPGGAFWIDELNRAKLMLERGAVGTRPAETSQTAAKDALQGNPWPPVKALPKVAEKAEPRKRRGK